MNPKSLLTYLFLLLASISYSQTYSGPVGNITDDGVINDFVLDIGDLSPATLSAEHGLTGVCISITHTWISDLDVRLISPSGENISLTSGLGWDTDYYDTTCFSMTATTHILQGSPPFKGIYLPFTSLGNANNGQSGNGKWLLRILDTYAYADAGSVLGWSLTFGSGAAEPVLFTGTALPIIVLNTDNNTIPNEPRIKGRIEVKSNDSGGLNFPTDPSSFEGYVDIEVRGSSSQQFPKKNYSFETQDAFGQDMDTTLLGLPKEEDWILYAPYTDKSLVRDAITYQLGNDLGEYAPRTVACEVFVNGDYQGIYWLEEKIKRDNDRVDIKKLDLTDTIGNALTGGYILKVDRDNGGGSYFVSQYEGTNEAEEIRLVYSDPESQELHPKQKAYIEEYFGAFEASLFGDNFKDSLLGYRRYVDMNSLLDYFIICELGHNIDAYRLSAFLYKNRNDVDSVFHFGPLWDFNLAFGNADYCNGQSVEGWAFEDSGNCGNTPRWWARLQEDPYFQDRLRCRYDSLRETTLSNDHLPALVDSLVVLVEASSVRNYEKWPILGIYVWPNFYIGQTYADEVNYLKQWIGDRLAWLDTNIPGVCQVVSAVDKVSEEEISLAPNPATSSFSIRAMKGESEFRSLSITGINGIELLNISSVHTGDEIDISHLPFGMYIVSLKSYDGTIHQQKLIVGR